MATGFKGIRNENGRPKGSANKNTVEIRNSFQYLIENNLEQLESDLKELKPFERIKVILELSKFVLPTMKAVEVTDALNENGFNPIIVQITTEQDIKKMINEFNDQY
jgi:biopolymer transport protein ExbD